MAVGARVRARADMDSMAEHEMLTTGDIFLPLCHGQKIIQKAVNRIVW